MILISLLMPSHSLLWIYFPVRLWNDFQEFSDGKWLVAVSAVIKIDIAGGILVVEFVEEKRLFFWHMADQDIAAEGDAHPVAGEVVGSDLLFGLQLDFRDEMTAV